MHKKILLCINKNQFENFDYKQPYNVATRNLLNNSGNNVFEYALQKMLIDKDVEVDYNYDLYSYTDDFIKQAKDINAKYDCMVMSPANIFSRGFAKRLLPKLTENISSLTIPVYIVGIGMQGKINYSFDFLKKIKDEVKKFVSAVQKNGGKLGLRGYFTEACLKELNIDEKIYHVIGCPSLYQNGRNLKIEVPKVDELKIAFNGNRMLRKPEYKHCFTKYLNSIFVDQDELYKFIFLPNELKNKDMRNICLKHIEHIVKEKRAVLYCNYQSWAKDLIERKINFSYGTRIHGNIVPLLQNIPAVVEVVDSRTRELADFFKIPSVTSFDKSVNFKQMYDNLDYSEFNKTFPKNFDNFKKFMTGCGLPCLNDMSYIEKTIPPFDAFNVEFNYFKNASFKQNCYKWWYKMKRLLP